MSESKVTLAGRLKEVLRQRDEARDLVVKLAEEWAEQDGSYLWPATHTKAPDWYWRRAL